MYDNIDTSFLRPRKPIKGKRRNRKDLVESILIYSSLTLMLVALYKYWVWTQEVKELLNMIGL